MAGEGFKSQPLNNYGDLLKDDAKKGHQEAIRCGHVMLPLTTTLLNDAQF